MKPEVVRDVLESYLRAWATGDKALLLSLFAPDCEWSDPVGTPPFKGHEGVGRFWDFAHQDASRTMAPKLHRLVVCANEGILNFTMQVRVPAHNQGLDLNIIDRFVLNDAGKIRTAQAYWDAGSLAVPEGLQGFAPNIDEASTSRHTGVDHVLPDIDFGRDRAAAQLDWPGLIAEAGERVMPVRYLGTAWLILRHGDVGRAFRDPRQFPRRRPACATRSRCRQDALVHGGRGAPDSPRARRGRVSAAGRAGAAGAVLRLAPSSSMASARAAARSGRRVLPPLSAAGDRAPARHIPAADEEQLFAWVRGLFDYPFNPQVALTARDEVNAFLLPLIHARRSAPRADLISRLASAQVQAHSLSDEDILSFVKLLFPAGADTTYLTMGSMMNAVLGDEGLRARLLREPARIADAVEGGVRLYGAVGLLPRYTRAARVGGVDIPPDSWVLFGCAFRRTRCRAVRRPGALELTRHAQRLVSFGGMPHFCLGVHLAKAELATSLELLLARLPGLQLAQGRCRRRPRCCAACVACRSPSTRCCRRVSYRNA
jgi:steroid delta-isomerase